MSYSTPTHEQIHGAAVDAIAALRRLNVVGCFVGGYACKLYGVSRRPHDLDILCLETTLPQEDLKARMTRENSRFYLVDSRSPTATYKVLWYKIDWNLSVKVDLLYPGNLDIPRFSSTLISRRNNEGLPCAPLSLVLLLKLQAWVHHRQSSETRFREKVPMDARDIEELLDIGVKMGISPRTDSSLPPQFLSVAQARIAAYVSLHPSSARFWKSIGMMG